jgi:hypothetical protein
MDITLVKDQLDAQFFFLMFISILYMFRATSCSSSEESIVSIQRLVYVTLCRWRDLHTRRSPTQSDLYQKLYGYNWFSWWWARDCSKHVENWNKYIKKELCFKLVIYRNYTEMHGQQNIKNIWICSRIKCSSIFSNRSAKFQKLLTKNSRDVQHTALANIKNEIAVIRQNSMTQNNINVKNSCNSLTLDAETRLNCH